MPECDYAYHIHIRWIWLACIYSRVIQPLLYGIEILCSLPVVISIHSSVLWEGPRIDLFWKPKYLSNMTYGLKIGLFGRNIKICNAKGCSRPPIREKHETYWWKSSQGRVKREAGTISFVCGEFFSGFGREIGREKEENGWAEALIRKREAKKIICATFSVGLDREIMVHTA